MESALKIGDVVVFKADKTIKLVITGIGNDGIVLLRYFDANNNDFKKVEMPAICFIKVED
jgi:NADH/NAD ratio-sensing transcriptional regulator Rex